MTNFSITIKTSNLNCIYLVGGLHGAPKTDSRLKNKNYECELIENNSALCNKKECPLVKNP